MTLDTEKDTKLIAPTIVYGGPTKRFFVSMLTRDIELNDAILDLVDNCVDGAIRQSKIVLDQEKPYKNFKTSISMSATQFTISDNCGGIEADFIDDAFSLGRPNIKKDGDLPTIGMYGIGMKRAIFKIGSSAIIQSNSKDGFFEVSYSDDWLNPENMEWNLPIKKTEKKEIDDGVIIIIDRVKPDIGRDFEQDRFINRLKGELSEHFGYLIEKGFQIEVNGQLLEPIVLSLFNSNTSEEEDIQAFDFETKIDDVSIKVTIGFFRGLVKEQEIDEEVISPRTVDTAGISVICNDRVILIGDKTIKTGWGDGGVPNYHPQFRAIAGLIVFSSKNAEKLPISTTKRGLDVGSEIYLKARSAASEGLKIFTGFTNKWKGIEDETVHYFRPAYKTEAKTAINLARNSGSPVRGMPPDTKKYVPNLPSPKNTNDRKRISFLKDSDSIKLVSQHLFGDDNQSPATIGSECFDRILNEVEIK